MLVLEIRPEGQHWQYRFGIEKRVSGPSCRWELSSYLPVRVPGPEMGRDFWSVVVRGLLFVLLLYLLMKLILF